MRSTNTNLMAPLEAARKLTPWITGVADDIDRQRELPSDLAEAMADAGLFRMLVPRSLGGSELDMPTYIEVIETVAKADGSTGWCVNQGAVFATNAAFLSQEAARQIWEDPRAVIANGPAPTAQAIVVDGGYRVTGRWTFSSGCRHATWLAGFAVVIEKGYPRYFPDGTPEARNMLFPKSAAEIIDAWNVNGLRGTGSHHFTVTDLFVPRDHAVWTYVDTPKEPGPLYVYPTVLLFASGFASVALGVARSALDTLLELAGGKKPRGDQDILREQVMVQSQVGQAEATWRAARAFLHHTVREVWEAVVASRAITLEQRVLLRLATTHAIRQAAVVLDMAYNASGASAIYCTSPLQRRFQDMHVITQHLQGRMAHYASAGQFFLGNEPDLQWL